MVVFIRTDANSKIGTGHLARCIILAEVFGKKGIPAIFVLNDSNTELIHSKIADRFEVRQVSDSPETLVDFKAWSTKIPGSKILLVDSDEDFYYEEVNQQRLRDAGFYLALITFRNDCHFVSDALINLNIRAKELNYSHESHTKLLLGAHYQVFSSGVEAQIKAGVIPFEEKENNLLIFFGGVDHDDRTGWVLEQMESVRPLFNEIHVIVGSLNQKSKEIKKKCEEFNCSLHIDIDYLPSLMNSCKFAMSSGGTATLELGLFHSLNILIPYSTREIITSNFLGENQLAINLGELGALNKSDFEEGLKKVIGDEHENNEMTKNLSQLISIDGKIKLVEALLAKATS